MAKRRCLDCPNLTTSTRCATCRAAKERRRAATRPHYQGDYKARRAQLQATATHCWLCGQGLPGYPWPHPLSTTADHVVPGDPTSELRPAHLRCNTSRGAKRYS